MPTHSCVRSLYFVWLFMTARVSLHLMWKSRTRPYGWGLLSCVTSLVNASDALLLDFELPRTCNLGYNGDSSVLYLCVTSKFITFGSRIFRFLFVSKQAISLLPNLSQWSCSAQVQGCSDTVRQPDAGCCRPQRKSPGMEGNRGVERALADNGQPVSVGRPELKNKTSSCLSLVAKHSPQHFLLLPLVRTSSVNKKWSFQRGLTYAC